jgi:CheY-like chemotaxis protein
MSVGGCRLFAPFVTALIRNGFYTHFKHLIPLAVEVKSDSRGAEMKKRHRRLLRILIFAVVSYLLLHLRGLVVGMDQTRVMGKRILLVEDERWVRECIKRLLWLDAHTVTEAANGSEAVALFVKDEFDIVITDYDMPGMAGDELVANIRSISPSQPILLITACADRFIRQASPADAILGKPFGVAELRQTLAALLE